MSNIEDLIMAVAKLEEAIRNSNRQINEKLEAHTKQVENRFSSIENRIGELSGGMAVVLNRSEENKAELEEHKKKLEIWQTTVSSLISAQRYLKNRKSILGHKLIRVD